MEGRRVERGERRVVRERREGEGADVVEEVVGVPVKAEAEGSSAEESDEEDGM
jgi:hypothetical protein